MPQPFLTKESDIQLWLEAYFSIVGSYAITAEGTVNVTGYLSVKPRHRERLTGLAIKFGTVSGNMSFAGCTALQSLRGSPDRIGGHLDCCRTGLLDLREGPATHTSLYYCYDCPDLKLFTDQSILIEVGHMATPSAAEIKNLLTNRCHIHYEVSHAEPWMDLVNSYHAHGDLLTTIARFEELYEVPFHAVEPPPALAEGFGL